MLQRWPASGRTTRVQPGMADSRSWATAGPARMSFPPYTRSVGTSTWVSTVRRFSADARAIARKPSGENVSMLTRNASIVSAPVA